MTLEGQFKIFHAKHSTYSDVVLLAKEAISESQAIIVSLSQILEYVFIHYTTNLYILRDKNKILNYDENMSI